MSGANVKRILLAVLAILLISIWIRNLFLLLPDDETAKLQSPSPVEVVQAEPRINRRNDSPMSFSPELRDPFVFPSEHKPARSSGVKKSSVPLAANSIRAALLGHVYNKQQSYIVAFDSVLGMSSLYHTGDTLNLFELKKISRTEAVWTSVKGRRLVWKTNPGDSQ